MDTVVVLWQRIETWLQTFAPQRRAELRPGVTSEELVEAEVRLGLTLPEDFKASYRIHDGAEGHGYLLMGYPNFFPLRYVRALGPVFQDPLQNARWANREPGFVSDPARQSQPIQPVWCHPQWLLFASNGGGYYWCVDLAPAPGGTSGQIISWDHEDGPAHLLFPGFNALLATYTDQLEAGLYCGDHLIIQLEKLTYLQERRAAFQQPSPAKSLLFQAIKSAWDLDQAIEDTLDLFKQIFRMEAATSEDRFFAYYGYITVCVSGSEYDDEIPELFARLEVEAQSMPATHWIHEEMALLKSWSV